MSEQDENNNFEEHEDHFEDELDFEPVEEKKEESFSKALQKDFLYGLIVVIPVVATIWLVIFVVNLFSGPIGALLPQKIPVTISFVLTLILITLIGIAARNIIGRAVLVFFEGLFARIPIINIIYRSTTQIVNAFKFKDKSLLSAALVEYPRKGMWALAFVTKKDAAGLKNAKGVDIGAGKSAVFIPTTPNPTSGYFVYLDKKEVIELSMSVEDSIKVLMSAGVVSP